MLKHLLKKEAKEKRKKRRSKNYFKNLQKQPTTTKQTIPCSTKFLGRVLPISSVYLNIETKGKVLYLLGPNLP